MAEWFIVGIVCGIMMMGFVHLAAMKRWEVSDREFRREQAKRIDDLHAWSRRRHDETRKELGMPPRTVQ